MSADASRPLRFRPGDRVKIRVQPTKGHCRTPWYLRGQTGTVAEVHGAFLDPVRLAYHKPGLPMSVLYKVRFEQQALWPGYRGPASDHLEADIYDDWLERA